MSYLHSYLPHLFGKTKGQSFNLPSDLDWGKLNFEELLMFHTLKGDLKNFLSTLNLKALSDFEVYHLLGFHEYLPSEFFHSLKELYKDQWAFFEKAIEACEISTNELQNILDFKTGKLSLFALLHIDRTRPGKLFIRREDGSFLHKENGKVWSIPVLGLSGRSLAFNHSNGSTPCGVYTVDSVMPEANRNFDFGKFRRLIVNFINKSPDESLLKEYLPKSIHKNSWWYPCVLGRELGRSLLRIHGTGDLNKNLLSPYYPMIPTSGCLATTERSFFGLWENQDQRVLLDSLMEALNLHPSFENESKIHGLLYVIDFDGKYQTLHFRA